MARRFDPTIVPALADEELPKGMHLLRAPPSIAIYVRPTTTPGNWVKSAMLVLSIVGVPAWVYWLTLHFRSTHPWMGQGTWWWAIAWTPLGGAAYRGVERLQCRVSMSAWAWRTGFGSRSPGKRLGLEGRQADPQHVRGVAIETVLARSYLDDPTRLRASTGWDRATTSGGRV